MKDMEVYGGKKKMEVKRERTVRRSEAILVKDGQDTSWTDSYREIVGTKSALKETIRVQKTRAGHILIELNSKVTADDNLKKAMRQAMKIVPPASRETLEIKNIDPIAMKEELVEDISTELDIKDER
jgi:hypothetical protein